MRAVPFSIPATLLPGIIPDDINTYRCVHSLHEYSSPKAINWAPRRHRFGATNRSHSFSVGIATNRSSNVQSPAAVPTSVPVRVAHELLQAGHHYLDVRTSDEFSSGHVVGAVNVPFMLRLGPGMTRNPRFLEEVLTHFRKDDEIIVGCQLGKRSLVASSELLSAGFTGITDMAGGYAAWIQIGLPTE